MARWFKGKEGGKAPPEALILQMGMKFNLSPVEVEDLPIYWFNRMAIWMEAEAAGEKLK
jgi:hypothetical protein